MEESLVALTYGSALYEAAKELNQTSQIREQVTYLAKIFEGEPEFKELLGSPEIDAEDKKQIVRNVFGEVLCDEMINFMYILIDKGRTGQIRRIAKQYVHVDDEAKRIAEGKIFSAVELSQTQLEKFQDEMSKLLRKQVLLKNYVDKSLIGGVKIRVDGKMIDKSLKSELDKLLQGLNS